MLSNLKLFLKGLLLSGAQVNPAHSEAVPLREFRRAAHGYAQGDLLSTSSQRKLEKGYCPCEPHERSLYADGSNQDKLRCRYGHHFEIYRAGVYYKGFYPFGLSGGQYEEVP